ncbi:biopolymer transporter ExbD [Pelagicoccus sp. NFK12]|uniref:Biopolymer transporter ExbD n=1 Tax=Pelagicoccus enzymogenes TaxID=2773457 RepID=A0A927IH73_9BACT|nr:biopolymer transporter ExbD [Pelagicoccus enzymogenes]MBD5779428.1 biopolymer transporter ExbD [Pelagicoccus enzymogenes]MDQ8200609.1 biopolymer transporter ExbD [Pelagicoccus enzymogenes]
MAVSVKRGAPRTEASELPIAPMIDVVFLLLVYFMVSSSIQKQEADIGFSLPAVVKTSEPVSFPDEQVIEIDAEGRAWVNGYAYDDPEEASYLKLAQMLSRYREGAQASQSSARVTIAPSDSTPHQMVVRVMDACQLAGLESVSFAVE